MTAEPVSPPPLRLVQCPACMRKAPLLVEGSDLCLGCDSLIPTRPFPGDDVMVQNFGQPLAYIGGDGHRPIPTAGDPVRRSHQPQTPKPTGLDWDKLRVVPDPAVSTVTELPTTRPCKECRVDTALEDLVDGFCPICRDEATARFAPTGTAPHDPVTPGPVPAADPTREVVTVATPSTTPLPAYVDDIVAVMVATDGHPDPAVRAARKVVANALVQLHKTLAGVFPQTPTAAAGGTGRKKASKLTDEQWDQVARRYEAGESQGQLATAFGVSQHTVSVHLRRRGVKTRPANFGANPEENQ